jgi:hypothetical protein
VDRGSASRPLYAGRCHRSSLRLTRDAAYVEIGSRPRIQTLRLFTYESVTPEARLRCTD